jgi:hypothetical protein
MLTRLARIMAINQEDTIMFNPTIYQTTAIALITLLSITGCSSHSHHHNKKVQPAKMVVVTPVVVTKAIRQPVAVKKRVVIINR